MEAEQEKQVETSRPRSTGPGEQLQAARIRKGLSLEDVANRMHLSASILEAIEDNHFEEITAPIFVKGYLRAYARIVSLDEDDMIQQYLDLYSEEDPPINSTSNMAPELSSDDTRIKWTTYLVVVLLAVLLGAWWWNKQQNHEAPVSLDVQAPAMSGTGAAVDSAIESDTVTAEVVVDESTGQVPDGESEDDFGDSEVTPSSEAVGETATPAPAAAETGMEMASDTAAAMPAAGEPVMEAAVEGEPAELAAQDETPALAADLDGESEDAMSETPAEPETGTRERPGRAAPVGDDKLLIVVHADTWADVKDSNNFQLEYNLLRAGSSVEFTGQAPFSVFLGNGHGVEVLFNGEEIGFASRIRDDNTARLNVGG